MFDRKAISRRVYVAKIERDWEKVIEYIAEYIF